MAKFYTIIAIIAITLTSVVAEPPRFKQSKRFGQLRIQNNKISFARQEEASDTTQSSKPYPPAGVTPEIPFDLPTETDAPIAEPDQTYGPPGQIPDETYGPPKETADQTYSPPEPTPDQTYGPPEANDVPAITEPDNTYGPPSTDNQTDIEELEAEELTPPIENTATKNLIKSKNKNARSRSLRSRLPPSRSHSAALRQRIAPVQPRFNTVEIIHSDPVLVYTLH